MKSHQDDCLNMSRTKTAVDVLTWMGESPGDPQLHTKNSGHEGMPRVGETVFPGEEHTGWLSSTKCSALKTCI